MACGEETLVGDDAVHWKKASSLRPWTPNQPDAQSYQTVHRAHYAVDRRDDNQQQKEKRFVAVGLEQGTQQRLGGVVKNYTHDPRCFTLQSRLYGYSETGQDSQRHQCLSAARRRS